MAIQEFDFTIEQPISVWNREISFDTQAFFAALGKGIVSGAVLDYKGIAENAIDAGAALGLKEKGHQVLSWELINISLHRSIVQLISENKDFIIKPTTPVDSDDLAKILFSTIESAEIGINSDFFERPQELQLLKTFEQPLIDWFSCIGIPIPSAKAIYLRLKDRFASNLHAEWVSDSSKYLCIEDNVKSPFLQANKTIRQWKQYSYWLQEEANKPVFEEAFGLRQIYVPLRGYYKEKIISDNLSISESNNKSYEKYNRHVIDVHTEVEHWVNNFSKENSVKVISGGPGSGKSSFAKILAANISKNMPEIPVLFIPLHYFDIEDDLTQAVDIFIKDDRFLTVNPLNGSAGSSRLLIIFDGLDELSMQGKAASDSALEFVDEVITKINRFNDQGHERQAIITGRDVSIQSSSSKLRKKNQIINLLPYHITSEESKKYIDPNNLLNVDQRNIWWKKYSLAKGKKYKALPKELNTKSLLPITKEPLLNYLVALSFEGGRINFKDKITLNTIYSDLLAAVHLRQWDHGNHKGACNLEKDAFERVLEEIALAVWHGHGRTATLSNIHQACEKSNITKQLEFFQDGAKKGVTKLLTAFYFRESDSTVNAENTFEFTHKSFGEYLISRRIIRHIKMISNNLQMADKDIDFPFSESTALSKWGDVFGTTPMDMYVFNFLNNEIKSNEDSCSSWQETIIRLARYSIKNNMPLNSSKFNNIYDISNYCRNSTSSLLVIHYLCANITKKTSLLIDTKEHESNYNDIFIKWFNLAMAESSNIESIIHEHSLSYLSIKNIRYLGKSFLFSSINHSDLSHSNLAAANFLHSNLSNSTLIATNFNHANLYGSVLDNVDLTDASLSNANISDAHLVNSNLTNSDLTNSNLSYTDLTDTDFTNANLNKTNLTGANLTNTNFTGANLTNSNFTGADLTNSNLSYTDLTDTDFTNANLTNTNFTDADLTNSNFTGANFTDTH